MKTVGKYFTLTILMLLGLGCIGVLYLFFVPGSTLFNIRYLNAKETAIKEFSSDISTINLNSRDYDVSIVTNEEDKITLTVYANSFGFVLTKDASPSIYSEISSGVLSIEVNEPHGFALPGRSYVELSIPEDKRFNYNLTNNKAETFVNNSELKIGNLSYKTNNGDLNLTACKINGNLALDLNKATCTVSEGVTIENTSRDSKKANLELKLTTGKFYAKASTFDEVNITKNDRGVIEFKESLHLREDIASSGGRIVAEKIYNISIKSSATNIYVKEITGGAIIELSSGNVEIDSLTGNSSTLTTDSGNITLNNVYSPITTTTKNGNITIKNAFNSQKASTSYGDINITFNPSATSKYIDASLKNGKLVVAGIEKISLTITGNGRAELDMANIVGQSYIDGKSGSIFVKVNKDSVYKLLTESEGSVRVNLTQIPQYGGYTTKTETITYVNCNSGGNNGNELHITTGSGDLTVLDSNFA